MDPRRRRRLAILVAIVLIVGVLAAIVATQPGSTLRNRWELARVRKAERTAVLYLAPDAALRDDPKTGWRISVLQPSQPVWRFKLKTLHLLPGCEIVLPAGETLVVSGSADSTEGAAFTAAATAAMTATASERDEGRELVSRRAVVGEPPYEPIEANLARGAKDSDEPPFDFFTVSGRPDFFELGDESLVRIVIPQKQAEASQSGVEWQYAVLEPETLYVARDSQGRVRTISPPEAKLILRSQTPAAADVSLQHRGQGVFVVQMRVRDE